MEIIGNTKGQESKAIDDIEIKIDGRYSTEFKKMIATLHGEDRVPLKQLKEKYGVSNASITKWCRDAGYGKSERLAKSLGVEKLKKENDLLKCMIIALIRNGMEEQE